MTKKEKEKLAGLIFLLVIIMLAALYIGFGLVPTLVETAKAQNWNGLGENNKWFYFFYFLTIPFFLTALTKTIKEEQKYES